MYSKVLYVVVKYYMQLIMHTCIHTLRLLIVGMNAREPYFYYMLIHWPNHRSYVGDQFNTYDEEMLSR